MTSNLRINLLQSIADTIADYRQGEIAPITADHVDKWVSQFDEDEQIIILGEMNHLLGKYYISQQQAKEIISRMLKLLFAYYKKIGTNPTDWSLD